MKVIDLIIALQQQDPNLDVVKDMTKEPSDVWKLAFIHGVEEVNTPEGEKYVMLHGGNIDFEEINEN